MSHTPAPWKKIQGRLIGGDGTDVVAAGVGLGLGSDNGDGVRAANARLIWAAPELLEALLLCFDYPSEVFEIADSELFTMTVTGRHLRMVKAAIAKATGDKA